MALGSVPSMSERDPWLRELSAEHLLLEKYGNSAVVRLLGRLLLSLNPISPKQYKQ